jgi:hypothetical protein
MLGFANDCLSVCSWAMFRMSPMSLSLSRQEAPWATDMAHLCPSTAVERFCMVSVSVTELCTYVALLKDRCSGHVLVLAWDPGTWLQRLTCEWYCPWQTLWGHKLRWSPPRALRRRTPRWLLWCISRKLWVNVEDYDRAVASSEIIWVPTSGALKRVSFVVL